MAAIELDSVTKDFPDGTRAVDDVDLAVADGEFMILVGPSGCGKTTALRMVAGLESVSSGEIRIGGSVVNDLDPVDRDVAMVFQNYALYPHMSVRDNIGFPLRMQRLGKKERSERVTDAARMLGIEDLLHRKPRELSGGQRQRVAMGRAVVRHPQAFLMDEPLSNLDAKLRVQMRAELVKLHARLGVTTIYVTHDQTEAMTLGQRVAVLSKGVVQQVDTPQRLYTHPANTFVASFIGSPAMNFLPGKLRRGGLELDGIRLELPDGIRARLEGDAQDVLIGLRPEAFDDARLEGDQVHSRLRADVEITEQLGPETIAYVRVEGLQTVELGERPVELAGALAVRLDPRTDARPGAAVELGVDLGQVHLFDARSGLSLLR
ncbi:MAG TPA: sn-glycerol-3-phosphate ABC transporter ATP-binding protein UgpC [Gaiellaceae bacterium]|nr:sn-glycerol-3-phosphate ABC transporter ATP-binding protein UgpC [Gaiellaceae bacterium]